jgi:hypothetical protein
MFGFVKELFSVFFLKKKKKCVGHYCLHWLGPFPEVGLGPVWFLGLDFDPLRAYKFPELVFPIYLYFKTQGRLFSNQRRMMQKAKHSY